MPFQEGEDDFYVISESDSNDTEKLEHLKEVLINAEPITAELWRAERLFHCPNSAAGVRYVHYYMTITTQSQKRTGPKLESKQ